MSGKSLTQAMFTNAATDGLNDARSLRRKAAAQRKLRKAVGAWFDQLEARQMLNAIILGGTGTDADPFVINEDPSQAAIFQVQGLSSAYGTSETNGSVSFDPTTGEVRYSPNANFNGIARLKYLSNGSEKTVTFQVRDVNDGPTFDFKAGLPVENGKPIVSAVEDTADTYKIDYIISNLGVGPADESGQQINRDNVTVSPATDADGAKFVPGSLKIEQMFEKNPDGTDKLVNGQKVFLGYQLQFKLVGDKSGDATVSLSVSDTGAIRADGRGDVNTTKKDFIIRIADVNDPTQVGTQIVAPDATQGADYNFNLPASAFTDIDPAGSETITYQAEGLPSWLRFDNNNTEKVWHFYGKPTAESDVGSVTIKVTALDRGGWSVFQNFTLKINDRVDAPVQNPNAPFGPLSVLEDDVQTFTLPTNLFTDPDIADQGKLVYTVRLDGDNDLPSWIEFTNLENGSLKNQYGKLTIRPSNANVGTLRLVVKASDGRGGVTTSAPITLTVINTIDVPVLKNQIQNQPGAQDLSFTYTVPANTFEDVDAGDQAALAYKAEWLVTENGQEIAKALPSWLSFDPATRRFSGLPTSKDPGNYKIRVTVTDPDASHATATCDFFINIADAADAPYSDPIMGVPNGIESKQFNNSADGFSLMGFFHDDDATYGQRLDHLAFTAMAINPDGTEAQWPAWLEPIVNSPTAALKGVPGHSDVGQTTIKVIATDTTNRSTSRIFTLTVTNFNNAPTANPITVTPTVQQDANLNWALPANTFVDIDLGYGDALTYTAEKIVAVEGQPTQYVALPAWLQINSANGTFTGTPRNADVGTYQIRVTATDRAGEKVSTNFTLVVTNKEDDPRAIGGVIDRSIREGQLWVYEAKNDVYDPDTLIPVGETVNYEVFTIGDNNTLGPKPAWLHINAATGQLSGTPSNGDVTAFSQTGPIKLRVVCTDVSQNKSAYQDYRVAIVDTPEAPVAANPFGAAPAAVVGQLYTFTVPALTFVDPDLNDSYTLSAKQADGSALPSWLSFDPVTRTFSGTPSGFANYQITLSATDTTSLVGTMTFGLRVGNPNQVPVVVAPIPDWQVLENTTDPFKAVTYTIPAGTFVDPDANDTLTYTADWDRTKFGWLTFDPTTRTFSGQVVKNFAGRVDITVTAKDSSGATASDVFTFEVVNVNQGPSFPAITDVYLNQEETRQFVISPATDADLPYGDQLTYTAVQLKWEQPQNGAGSWVAYPLPSWIVFNPGTQSFTVTPPTYYAGDTKVQVTVSDRYNEKVSQIFNVHVLNTKNDAPISGTLGDVTLLEDQAWKLVLPGNLLRDPDLGLDAQESVSYQIFWLEQTGVQNGQPVYMEHATGSQIWMQVETNPITSADPSKVPTLIGTPDDVNIGTTRYRVRATDRLGLHTDVDFNVTVLAVNDTPIITYPDNLAVNENVTEATAIPGISVTDEDAGSQTISLQLTAGAGTLQIDGLSGMGLSQFSPANGKSQSIFLMGSADRIRVALAALKYMPPSAYIAQDSIAVVANDFGNVGAGGPKTDVKYVPVHINAINHAPVANNDTYGSITEDRTQAYILNVTLNDSKGPANEAGQKLRISSVNPTGAHGTVAPFYDTQDGLWKIAYTPDANYYGPVSFTYRVMDDGTPAMESNDATVSFNVDGVNDVPDFTLAQSITVNENDNAKVVVATNITPGAGESADQTVTFEVSVTQGANLFDVLPQIDASGKLVFQLKDQANGTVKMTVRMRDNLGLYDTHNPASQLTMTVNPVNDGPRFGTILLGTINENTAANATSVRFTGEYLLSAGVDPEGRDYPLSLVPGSIQSDVYYDASDTAHANPHAYGTVTGPDINGYYTFTPAQEYWGDAWVVFTAQDSTGVRTTAKAKVTMLNTYNNAPTTAPDVMNMEENSGRSGFQDSTPNVDENNIDVVKNDHDVNMNGKDYALWLVASKIGRPAHGTAIVIDNNTIRYIPDLYFNGQDSFTYTITDQQGREATGTVTVNVSRKDYAPVAYSDSATTKEHNMISIPVLVNDEIPDFDQRNDTVIVVDSIISGPAHGTAAKTSDGQRIEYTPTGHYNGLDSFQYRIKTWPKNLALDGVLPAGFEVRYATATVSLTVYNDPNDDTFVVNKNSGGYTFNPLANDVGTLADGATWTPVINKITVRDNVKNSDGTNNYATRTYNLSDLTGKTITFAPTDASNVNTNGGTLTYDPSTKMFTYKPKTDTLLADSFTYEVNSGNSSVGTVVRTVRLVVNQPPAAGDVNFGIALGTDNQLPSIVAQDAVTDDDKSTLKLDSIGSASKGTAWIANGNVYYRPGEAFDGKDTFTYTVKDSNGVTATGKVNVLFTRGNNDAFTVNANTFSNTLKVLDNDYTVPNVSWAAVEIINAPVHGTATVNSDKTVNYVPTRHYYNDNDPANPDTFTYRVQDNSGNWYGPFTAKVTVKRVNEPTTVLDDAYGFDDNNPVVEDTTSIFNVMANDFDLDGDAFSIISVTQGTEGGQVSITADGKVQYTPKANWNTQQSFANKPAPNYERFTYQVRDTAGNVMTGTVTVKVKPVNDDPAATNDTSGVGTFPSVAGNSVNNTLPVLENDVNPDAPNGESYTIAAVQGTSAQGGTVVINGNGILYTPAAHFAGTDTFTYTIQDNSGSGKTSTATVTVTVTRYDENPIAKDDAVSVNENGQIASSITINVNDLMANDDSLDGDTKLFVFDKLGTPANGGTLTKNKDAGTITYTPAPYFRGTDMFTYTMKDPAGHESTAIVTVTVNPVNQAPVTTDYLVTTNEDTEKTIVVATDLAGSFNDPHGDALKVTSVTQPENGTVTPVFDPFGKVVSFTYKPKLNFFTAANKTDNFTYTVVDSLGASSTGNVKVTVAAVNDAPVARDQAFTVNEDSGVVELNVFNMLNQDNPDQGEALTLTGLMNVPAELTGKVELVGGKIMFTAPTTNTTAQSYTFNYVVRDAANLSATGKVTVTIVNVNDAPIANPDAATVNEDAVLTLTQDNLRGNDLDEESRPDTTKPAAVLTVVDVKSTDNTHGTVELKSDGSIVFTPAKDYNGQATFKYVVSDGDKTSEGTVTVTVNPVNDAPVVKASATAKVNEDATLEILPADLVKAELVGDVDTGDVLFVSGVAASNGNTVEMRDGKIYFTAARDFNGTTSFTYTVSDGHGGTATGTVVVTVDPVNDAPTLDVINSNNTYAKKEGETVTFTATGHDIDAGQTLTYSLVNAPAGATIDPVTGVFSWTPGYDQGATPARLYNFFVKVSDNGSLYAVQPVNVTVLDVPLPDSVVVTGDLKEGSTFTATYTGNATDKHFVWKVDGTVVQVEKPDHTWTGDVTTIPFKPADNREYTVHVDVWNKDQTAIIDTAERKVTVADVAPTIELKDGLAINEGQTYGLTLGGITDPGTDTVVKYAINWGDNDVTQEKYDGSPENVKLFHAYADSGTYTISVTLVNEDGTFYNAGKRTVVVNNVAPTATFTATSTVAEGSAATASFTGQADISPADMKAGLTYQYDFNNDGTFDLTTKDASVSVPASMLKAGQNTVKGRIQDAEGAYTDYTATINVTNVAPIVDLGAELTVGTNSAFTRTGSFVDPGTGTWTATVDYGDGQGAQPLTLSGKQFTLSHTYAAAGVYNVKVVVNDGATTGEGTLKVTAGQSQLQVTNVTATASGFDIQFNLPIDLSKLNLYDGVQNKGRAADLTIVGAKSGALSGTAIWEAATNTLHFVKTGGLLAADSYSVTLFSRADGFVGLDGDKDGNAGGNFVQSVNVAATTGLTATMPDIARGPKQSFSLPIRLSDTAGVQSFDAELRFDPTLLNVSEVTLAAGLPGDWTAVMNVLSPGLVKITAYGTTALTAGAKDLLQVKASVPSTASYAAAGMLQLQNVVVNDTAVVGDTAVAAVAYLGDASGNKNYTGMDAAFIANVVIGAVKGFDAFPTIDPVIIGDVNGNGSIGGLDASYVAQKSVGMAVTQIPDLPAATPAAPLAAKATATTNTAVAKKAAATVQAKKVFASGQIRVASTNSALIGKTTQKVQAPVFGGKKIESDILK